jgi:hypothetical protein
VDDADVFEEELFLAAREVGDADLRAPGVVLGRHAPLHSAAAGGNQHAIPPNQEMMQINKITKLRMLSTTTMYSENGKTTF